MQFKHPEILYFLTLLIIPILVHLFQLQRFVKVPFTNVAFLQKISMQTRKSSQLKKWLVLATRLIGLSALILAFAQPYFSNSSLTKKQHTFIYLDNSLSTDSKGEKGNLLQIVKQDIIENVSEKGTYSLLTNTNFFNTISSEELKNELKEVKNSAKKVNFEEVLLKISNENKQTQNTESQQILISDFQNTSPNLFKDKTLTLVQLKNVQQNNIAIDSVFIDETTGDNFNISIVVKNNGKLKKNVPIGIYNNEQLISKQSFDIEENTQKNISFSVQKTHPFLGKLNINFDDTFQFDNTFYFSINSEEKINVLAIGNDNKFLSKIYTQKEFNFINSSAKNVNYNLFEKQQLIILNGLETIPQTLISSLATYTQKGGNLVIIPNSKSGVTSYNSLFKLVGAGTINPPKKDSLKITKIHFSHPLLKGVFDKQISNFQYPTVQTSFKSAFKNASTIVSFENNKAFIEQVNLPNSKLFWVASALDKETSNFTNSPLIVPIFYNIGAQSLQVSKLFYRIDKTNKIDVNTQLSKDGVLELQGTNEAFIPLQQTHQNKVTLTTNEQPLNAGFYAILKQKDTLKSVAFNIPKEESSLLFLDISTLQNNNISVSNSVKDTLQNINDKGKIHWLWKWFLGLVILFIILEILILKFFKI